MLDINNILTIEDRNLALEEIDEMKQKIYQVSQKVPYDQKALDEMAAKVKAFNVLRLSLSFYPKERTLKLIHTWIRQNLGSGIILDVEKDRSMQGGVKIEFNGKYIDLSLSKKLDEYFKNYEQI